MLSGTGFIVTVCIIFAIVVCSVIFARPMARWLQHHCR
jgi:hypothetical protein